MGDPPSVWQVPSLALPTWLSVTASPPATAPQTRMDEMMSRGIDPDVADPSHCHSHPDVPDKWPSRQELCAYVADTRRTILQHGGLDSCCRHEETMRKVRMATVIGQVPCK
jgi:hypothetical protein